MSDQGFRRFWNSIPRAGLLLVIIYFAYISLGLPDSILGIAWPYMRIGFNRRLEEAGIITISLTICAAISSVLSGRIVNRFGTGRVTFISCLMTATGLLGYSLAPSFWWILACIPLLGFGAGGIDCGLNYYVAANYPSRHMNWLHSCWGLGATTGPLIMTAMITAGLGWRSGYRTVSLIQYTLAVILFASLGLWQAVQREKRAAPAVTTGENQLGTTSTEAPSTSSPNDSDVATATGAKALTPSPQRAAAFRLQIAIYVIYTSCEFLIGLWAFSLFTVNRQVTPLIAGTCVSAYYASLTVARILTGFIVERLGNRFMIRLGLSVALVGCGVLALPTFLPGVNPIINLIAVILLGSGFGPVYPCMTHETARRFRPEAAQSLIGYQAGAANIGSSTFPALVGWIGCHSSLDIVWIVAAVLIACTLAITTRLDRLTANGPL